MGYPFTALASKYGVSHQAIQKRAKAEGWGDGSDVADVIRRKVAEKVAKLSATDDPKKKAAALDAEVDRVAAIVDRHREDWEEHARLFPLTEIKKDYDVGRSAKISAEVLTLRHKGQRTAWSMDEVIDVTKMTDAELEEIIKGKR
jgi:hypothetical protein